MTDCHCTMNQNRQSNWNCDILIESLFDRNPYWKVNQTNFFPNHENQEFLITEGILPSTLEDYFLVLLFLFSFSTNGIFLLYSFIMWLQMGALCHYHTNLKLCIIFPLHGKFSGKTDCPRIIKTSLNSYIEFLRLWKLKFLSLNL